jgi:hypothetical protein
MRAGREGRWSAPDAGNEGPPCRLCRKRARRTGDTSARLRRKCRGIRLLGNHLPAKARRREVVAAVCARRPALLHILAARRARAPRRPVRHQPYEREHDEAHDPEHDVEGDAQRRPNLGSDVAGVFRRGRTPSPRSRSTTMANSITPDHATRAHVILRQRGRRMASSKHAPLDRIGPSGAQQHEPDLMPGSSRLTV